MVDDYEPIRDTFDAILDEDPGSHDRILIYAGPGMLPGYNFYLEPVAYAKKRDVIKRIDQVRGELIRVLKEYLIGPNGAQSTDKESNPEEGAAKTQAGMPERPGQQIKYVSSDDAMRTVTFQALLARESNEQIATKNPNTLLERIAVPVPSTDALKSTRDYAKPTALQLQAAELEADLKLTDDAAYRQQEIQRTMLDNLRGTQDYQWEFMRLKAKEVDLINKNKEKAKKKAEKPTKAKQPGDAN